MYIEIGVNGQMSTLHLRSQMRTSVRLSLKYLSSDVFIVFFFFNFLTFFRPHEDKKIKKAIEMRVKNYLKANKPDVDVRPVSL